jgi:hypothetical protein
VRRLIEVGRHTGTAPTAPHRTCVKGHGDPQELGERSMADAELARAPGCVLLQQGASEGGLDAAEDLVRACDCVVSVGGGGVVCGA